MNTSAQTSQTDIKTPRSSAGLMDSRADGGQRDVTLTSHRVTIRRQVAGMGMKIDVPTRAYRGVVLSLEQSARGRLHYRVTLRHSDPDLSVILTEAFDESEILKDWRDWASFLTQSPLVERDSGALVSANDPGLELTLVRQGDQHLVSAIHHVGVGHDEAVRTQDEARAHTALLRLVLTARAWALAGASGHGDAKATEELLHARVHLGTASSGRPPALGGTDVDDRRAHALHQFSEVRQ